MSFLLYNKEIFFDKKDVNDDTFEKNIFKTLNSLRINCNILTYGKKEQQNMFCPSGRLS
jgi:hypothetical protein